MVNYTKDDVVALACAIKRAKEVIGKPYNVLTGAGCSKSAGIPLATEFVREINKTYKSECEKHLSEDQCKDYGHCMSVVPKNERKLLLDKYLDEATVNWGHLAIAAMMEAGFISRVLTFNFDSILARACGLLGIYPATYDFSSGATKETHYIVEPSILHLHGQGHGIALLNTGPETQTHAENLKPLIRDTLNRAPLLIIGYSGQADAVFPVIESEYQANEKLCWMDKSETANPNIQKILDKGGHIAEFIGGADSDEILIELASELGCWPPKLFTNPYTHLLAELKPVSESSDPEIEAIIVKLRERLHADSELLAMKKTPDLTKMMMEGDWNKVIATIGDSPYDDEERDFLAWAQISLGNEFAEMAKITGDRALFKQAFGKYEAALEIKADKHEALNNWGVTLMDLGNLEGDKALFQEAIEKYEAVLEIKVNDHEALFNWGVALSNMGELEGDMALFERASGKYEAALDIKPDSHEAFNNWGIALSFMADIENDKELYERAIVKFEAAIEIKADKHEALNNWGNTLSKLAELEGDKALMEQASEKYEAALDIKPDNYEALSNWGSALSKLAKLNGDKALFEQAFEKFEGALAIKPDEYKTLSNWGVALADLAILKDEKELFEQAFTKYEAALEVNTDYHKALTNWGGNLLDYARIFESPLHLDIALEKLEEAKKYAPDKLYNLACAHAQKGNTKTCRKYLEHCHKVKTLPDRQHLETDPDLEKVRHLKWFSKLLDSND